MTAPPAPPPPPLYPPPPTALDAARSRIGAPARATIAAAEELVGRAEALPTAVHRLREAARNLVASLVRKQADALLWQRPLGDLRAVAPPGLRLGPLERAGLTTVGAVLYFPEPSLLALPGVGALTARQVLAAARRVEAQTVRGVRIRLTPDDRSPDSTRLLALLAAIRSADQAVAALRDPLQGLARLFGPLLAAARRATSRWRMLFARRATKQAALTCLLHLEVLLASPWALQLRSALVRAEQWSDPRFHEAAQQRLWRDYEADAASFNALLSTLGGTDLPVDEAAYGLAPAQPRREAAEDRPGTGRLRPSPGSVTAVPVDEAAYGFVPEPLRREVARVRLDTRLLRPGLVLRNYQAFGTRYALRQRRCMLGDEMGLGKTVQALAAVAHLAAQGHRHFLVVCPASVQVNWIKETERHTLLAAHSLHGPHREAAGRAWLRDGGVAVTTFDTLGRLECVRQSQIALLVVDEAHYVKNPATRRSSNVREVGDRTKHVLFLTGTPMQNRVEEFRSLVGHLSPSLARRLGADGFADARAFRRAVASVYLRRNQEDVLTELPDRIDVPAWVHLTSDDEAEYRRAVAAGHFMRMRQNGFGLPGSAKTERLREILEGAFADRRKVVVFSYFRGVLDSLSRHLFPGCGSHSRSYPADLRVLGPLTGSVPGGRRQQLVDEFTAHPGPAVLLSQIEAGGVGLNIQAASVVVIAEPQLTPGAEEQAIARVLRMGQVRTVQVHHLLARGSVDERIRELQEHKRLLFDAFARRSAAKEADARAVDAGEYRPSVLDDPAVPLEQRLVLAERHRLGV